MLKIMLYADIEHIYSSRKINSFCVRDINYIWLLDGASAPSHFEIVWFRSKRLAECAEKLFGQSVKQLLEMGRTKYAYLFANGMEIEANANEYTFV